MVTGEMIPGSADLSEAYAVREAVFVNEQGYALEIERDEKDLQAAHALVRVDEKAVATGRLFLDESAQWHIGRVAVLKDYRMQGIGELVMRLLLLSALEFGAEDVFLGSQAHAVPFYQRIGFQVNGPEYLDEGQPHLPMRMDKASMEKLFAGCKSCADA